MLFGDSSGTIYEWAESMSTGRYNNYSRPSEMPDMHMDEHVYMDDNR